MAASARHETRALLRAHLSAASSYRHMTRHCPVCHQLLRLAMEQGRRGEDGSQTGVEDEDPAHPARISPSARVSPPSHASRRPSKA